MLIDGGALRKAERLIESCEHCNEEGAEIPFDNILDRVTASDPTVDQRQLKLPVNRRNGRRRDKLEQELAVMRRLPERRTEDWSRWSGKVSAFSTVNVKHNIYSVDSRLIGEHIDVRVYGEALEVWHGGQVIERIHGCADRADIISNTGTLSIHWCASRERLPITVIRAICFRA